MSINQLILVSQETRTVLTASFLKTPKLRKWSMDQGNLMSEDSSSAQIRTLLEEQRQMIIAEYREKSRSSRTPSSSRRRRAPTSTRTIMATANWNFVKLINKVLQRWRNYENSRVLPSIRSRDESSSRTRTLFWNYQAEYRNCKMK